MTMPSEELRTLLNIRDFIYDMSCNIRSKRWLLSMLLSKKKRVQAITDCYYATKHYPFAYVIEQMWAERVEHEMD